MFEKFSRSWQLVKASAAVLKSDKELMLFPVISAFCTLLVLATFLLPITALELFARDAGVVHAVVGFLFYLCQYFVIIYFNSALVGAAMIRLEGGDPSLSDGFRIANASLGPILGYAAIAATVGLVLQSLRNKENNFLVRMLASGLGAAWTLATFLVVPVLVSQKVGPIDALKESVSLLKRTWGENAIGQMGIGAAFCLLMVGLVLLVIALTVVSFMLSTTLGVIVLALGVIAIALMAVVQAALSGIYSAALYRYTTVGEAPAGFQGMHLDTAFAPK